MRGLIRSIIGAALRLAALRSRAIAEGAQHWASNQLGAFRLAGAAAVCAFLALLSGYLAVLLAIEPAWRPIALAITSGLLALLAVILHHRARALRRLPASLNGALKDLRADLNTVRTVLRPGRGHGRSTSDRRPR